MPVYGPASIRRSPPWKAATGVLTETSGTLQVLANIAAIDCGPMRVLVVEDERKVADALRDGLEAEQYEVIVEHTGEAGFLRTTTEPFDLVLLDLGLPGRDGLEVLAAIRRSGIKTPVVVLTARDAVSDRVTGLDRGADDYLVKPFAFAELLARIRALCRRGRGPEPFHVAVGPVLLDVVRRRVTRNGEPVDLTTREFELLSHLMRSKGQVVPRESLAREVWKEPARTTSLDNVIDVHIARLRRKLDVDQTSQLIHTIRGVGFMMCVGEP
jgi:two-component system copper resistance phosphate regulon response regulator CusR